MSVGSNKATLMRGAEAFNNRNDRSGWFEIHDQAVIAHGLAPRPFDLAELEHFYGRLWHAFPDLEISVADLVSEGDEVAWRINVSGTHLGEFRGIAATGTEVTFGAQYIFRFRAGKIIERWTNLDRLGVLSQIGALTVPS